MNLFSNSVSSVVFRVTLHSNCSYPMMWTSRPLYKWRGATLENDRYRGYMMSGTTLIGEETKILKISPLLTFKLIVIRNG